MSLYPTTPTFNFPDGPETWTFFDDFSNGIHSSTTTGLAKWFLYESDAADTEVVASNYLRILSNAGTSKVHLSANRGITLNEMLAGSPIYFSARFRLKVASTASINIGLGIQDTNSYATSLPANFCTFQNTASTTLTLTATKSSVNSGTPTIGTIANVTWYRVAYQFTPEATPSSGMLKAWFNGEVVYEARVTTYPDAVPIFPVIDVGLGAAADYCDVNWLFARGTLPANVDGVG